MARFGISDAGQSGYATRMLGWLDQNKQLYRKKLMNSAIAITDQSMYRYMCLYALFERFCFAL
jgi:hypothetical protein